MDILISFIMMALGLILLIKGSDIFVDSGSNIGKIFRMSEILIGLTIVCFGTGLPEFLLSVNAAANNNTELAIGNIIGTNIFNMCCILGVICLLNPLKLLRQTIRKDINMSLLSSVILFVLLLDSFGTNLTENLISRTDGIILLLFFAIFMYYTLYEFGEYIRDRREKKYHEMMLKKARGETITEPKEEQRTFTKKDLISLAKNSVISIIAIAMVFGGSKLVIKSAVNIASFFNVSQTFISIAIIAIGTSLPEISTSIAAIKKNRINIAIGNLIGSNMFNTLFVLGVSSIINPIKLSNNLLLIDCIFFIIICLTMRLFTKKKPEINKYEGLTLLSIYLIYIIFVIYRR